MFAVTMEGGLLLSPDDICLTPAGPDIVPVPYPNTGRPELAEPVCETVLICGMPALNKSSTIELTDGDEAGVSGGVVSGRIMGPARFIDGSVNVMLQGFPAVCLADPTRQNGDNCLGSCVTPSQVVVDIME